jgi:stage II sporulation protein E
MNGIVKKHVKGRIKGTGEVAKETSAFVLEFMKTALSASTSLATALAILNGMIRNKMGECSASLDLYRLDLLTGEGTFLKSGAAHSYVKRADSLYRVRSETAPLGLLKSVDSEKIRIEIKPGDLVIMFSDGVAPSPESSVWLPELLTRDFEGSLQEYAEYILREARKNTNAADDASVSVARIRKIAD